MTIEELNNFRGLVAEYDELQLQINHLYKAVRSPFSQTGSHSSTPSDPTPAAVRKIDELKKVAEKKQIQIAMQLAEIENWLDGVEDAEIRAIVRAHFINGKTWKRTAAEVYGYADPAAPRMRMRRYFR